MLPPDFDKTGVIIAGHSVMEKAFSSVEKKQLEDFFGVLSQIVRADDDETRSETNLAYAIAKSDCSPELVKRFAEITVAMHDVSKK